MSSVVISGDTSGAITLAAPAVSGTNTITLPAATGTSVIQNASNNLLMNSGYGSDGVAYGCRAWVNFNGTGTVAIRASGNVSSITDNGVGDYTVNFTTALPDANYTVVHGAGSTSNDNLAGYTQGPCTSGGAPSSSAYRFRQVDYLYTTTTDINYQMVSFFR